MYSNVLTNAATMGTQEHTVITTARQAAGGL
jgi:hypothetical protein